MQLEKFPMLKLCYNSFYLSHVAGIAWKAWLIFWPKPYFCQVLNHYPTDISLGILGGGQLGKMLLQECHKLNIEASVLDPDPACVATGLTRQLIQGDFNDYDTVLQFGRKHQLITIEIEHVNTAALVQLIKEGVKVYPHPEKLSVIQDKSKQKRFFTDHHLPTAFYSRCQNLDALKALLAAQEISFPFVWKATHGGYDGKGVQIIHSHEAIQSLPDTSCIVESLVDIEKELAILVARNESGEVAYYPPVEMVFNPVSNLVEWVVQPANISPLAYEQIMELAEKVVHALEPIGILAIEMFLDRSGQVLLNELAPRPHNSGHLTIEANYTSQFEQHLRAILNLPLGDTRIKSPAVMLNLTGEKGYSGPAYYEGLNLAFQTSGASVHLYGKKQTRPDRKMGHITICAENSDKALKTALLLQENIKVISKNA